MTVIRPGARSRRLRNALLATVFSLGIVGAHRRSHRQRPRRLRRSRSGSKRRRRLTSPTVVEQVAPAVVSVQVKTKVAEVSDRIPEGMEDLPPGLRRVLPPLRQCRASSATQGRRRRPYSPRRGMSQGSGFFISEDGYVVTNNHVVEDGSEFQVRDRMTARELDAKLIGTDERTDLALLKVEGERLHLRDFANGRAEASATG